MRKQQTKEKSNNQNLNNVDETQVRVSMIMLNE